uniref:Protein TsetseEP domain-containing protein n=1 Tax=Anopheles atroparvus TaxID=41427 RepID=A0A182JNA7_ANOAO
MMPKWTVIFIALHSLLLLTGGRVEGFLLQYQNELSNLSATAIREVAASSATNSRLNGAFNELILTTIAAPIVKMRALDVDLAEKMQAEADNLDQACREDMADSYELFRWLWGATLRECMRSANIDLDYDTLTRFRPQASSALRIMNSATYQAVRTVAQSDIFDAPGIERKLADELQSYRGTWEMSQTTLQDDLDRHGSVVDGTMSRFEPCLENALVYQQTGIDSILDEIYLNCGRNMNQLV